jgi:hypothetical protein
VQTWLGKEDVPSIRAAHFQQLGERCGLSSWHDLHNSRHLPLILFL